ncbi:MULTISPECIES: cold-shock protein [Croceimicrobium]|uniref:Cold shock domain-containing protein n=1 Tax=Croceimicrobium hydrocarbonivorans TaxID=2761580 RepID=A0A7H0VAN1_9FLAO|nr:cold shock domain-containing protein [Croceimicrobium hydrocarbonivorans]QNR22779.1 cold shock domain-containing protein [Croceimicrobium hydrocarbonivorans]
MGRSQETFGKKEREKKRAKKKEEKERKRLERKANAGDKGDNITYMDVYGNFHDTPPEAAEKVKAKNIEIGVPKGAREDEEEDGLRKGTVTFYNESKGYGFIKDKKTGQSVFMHVNQLKEEVKEGNLVSFETMKGPKGPSAVNVQVMR